MKKTLPTLLTLIGSLFLLFTACKKDYFEHQRKPKPPIANAGSDTTIYLPFSSYTLNGNASILPNTADLTYSWRRIDGPSFVGILNYNKIKASASGLSLAGTYQFELTITFSGGQTSKDTVNVTVKMPNCTSNPQEVILKGLVWDYLSWIMEIDIKDIFSYVPVNSHITNFYIKRKSSADWETLVPLNYSAPDYTFHTWDYGNGYFIILPSNSNMEHDTVDVKIEYCN